MICAHTPDWHRSRVFNFTARARLSVAPTGWEKLQIVVCAPLRGLGRLGKII
jgi:hypothetical protein